MVIQTQKILNLRVSSFPIKLQSTTLSFITNIVEINLCMCDQSCLRSFDGKYYGANALHQTASSRITSWVEYISRKAAPEKPCETGGGSRDTFSVLETDPKQNNFGTTKKFKNIIDATASQ